MEKQVTRFASFTIFLASLTTLAGCASNSYEKMNSWSGTGYEEKEVAPNTYWLIYRVNALTVSTVAEGFWHQRAKELCNNRGYEHDAKVVLVNKTSYNPAAFSFQNHYFPHVEGTVKCKGGA